MSQDDYNAHRYGGAAVYITAPDTIRQLMLGKRLRKLLQTVEDQTASKCQRLDPSVNLTTDTSDPYGKETPAFGGLQKQDESDGSGDSLTPLLGSPKAQLLYLRPNI